MGEETIGDRLRRLRVEAGLSQRELAKRSDIAREYINQLEAGKTKSITLRTAAALAKGLGKPASVFFGESPGLAMTPRTSLADLELSIKAYIPVYAEVSTGPGTIVDYVACTVAKPAPETLRAYRTKGLCLAPEVIEGDVLIVDTALSPTNGDLCVVLIMDQASVKRYREDGNGKKWLENNNGTYQPEEVVLHGIVVGLYRGRR
jgi:transcriptional regulator with XRE-family HTH domain